MPDRVRYNEALDRFEPGVDGGAAVALFKDVRGRGACLLHLAVFAVLFSMLPSARPLHAHSWYPDRCCSGKDCRKVDKIEFLPDGGMRMRAGPIDVLVPRHFVQELSNDADAHICAVSITEGKYEPVCVFMPGTT